MAAVTAVGSVKPVYALQGTVKPVGTIKGSVKSVGTLYGSIKAARLTGRILSEGTLQGVVVKTVTLTGKMVVPIFTDHTAYEGSYVVTPTLADQELATINKLMIDNMTVQAIPYNEISNVDGTTVVIGG